MASLRLLPRRALRRDPRLVERHPTTSIRHASTSSPAATSGLFSLRSGIYASVFVVSTGLFVAYYVDSRAAMHRYVVMPVLRTLLDAETSHKLALRVLGSGLAPRDTQKDDERLRTSLWGEELSNPLGMAAGFDKDGEATDGLFNLGFSWVEIGSVTPRPQPGNPKPRVFRLPSDEAIINRYGFPSDGHTAVLARLRARLPLFQDPDAAAAQHASLRPDALLAVNLGKNKSSPADSIDDFVQGVHMFGPYADVLVINVSSPNTPGLRSLQTRALLERLLDGVGRARDELLVPSEASGTTASTGTTKPKLVLKIAPDLDEAELAAIAGAVRSSGVDGVIVSNTTIRRPKELGDPNKDEVGGLSGPPLKPYTLATLRTLRALLPESVPLIGCGGISSGADALDYARAGAAAVQVYTRFAYEGVGTCRRIKDELAEALAREGTTWAGVVRRAVGERGVQSAAGPADEGGALEQLRREAEELMRVADELGRRMEAEAAQGETQGVGADDGSKAVLPALS
ncbi:dihydroorotate dehydrogenase [Rhodofomes roseus]|uniref:Dihydroorotate dehydrogenase (quinone), mitochondrial n=1 Tax=Rhodofomes roseus TaxID=34475 RepID=A0ABQ8K013_9APHY|nr:dihydroorotate dehydrogenase [Rhodofomes roseus]KAH9829963.1 dihydroorotate dehydrogenase [Rhodofomes roseus]